MDQGEALIRNIRYHQLYHIIQLLLFYVVHVHELVVDVQKLLYGRNAVLAHIEHDLEQDFFQNLFFHKIFFINLLELGLEIIQGDQLLLAPELFEYVLDGVLRDLRVQLKEQLCQPVLVHNLVVLVHKHLEVRLDRNVILARQLDQP